MTDAAETYPAHPEPSRRAGMPTWLKVCLFGCGGLLVIGVLLVGVAIYWLSSVVAKYEKEFVDRGFEKVSSQLLVRQEKVESPMLFVGQKVILKGGARSEVALVAQIGELEGIYEEKVFFRGQIIVVKESAELRKGLDVECQVVTVKGTIQGPVTGVYQIRSDGGPGDG